MIRGPEASSGGSYNQATNLSSVGPCHSPPRHPCPPDTMLKSGGVAKTSAAGGCLIVQHCLRGEGVRRQEETELKFVDGWMGFFRGMRLLARTEAHAVATRSESPAVARL